MGPWLLPAAAGAFAAGLLAGGSVRPPIGPWVSMAIGAAALVVSAAAAARVGRGPEALVRARLVPADAPAVEAVAGLRRRPVHAPISAVALLLGLVVLGAAWSRVHDGAVHTSFLARLAPQRVTIDATLRTDPSTGSYGWSATATAVRVTWSGGVVELRSSLWVSGDGRPPRARRGDLVRLEGVVRVPDDAGFAEVLSRKGIAAQLQLSSFERLGPSPNPFVRASQGVRAVVARSIDRVFPDVEAGLLLGLLLGDDSRLDPGLERDFRAAGLSHMLVVSGENVAMVLAPVIAASALLRLSMRSRFVVALGIVVFFTILTGAEPSVLRASVMAGIALTGTLAGRPTRTASTLAVAVLALLVLDPSLVWAVGFQLSVAATIGMVAASAPLSAWFRRALPEGLAVAAAATTAAQLGVTPVLLLYFHEVPLVTLPANVLAFPLVSPALLLGAGGAAAGLVWMPLGRLLAAVAVVPMRGIELVADRLAKAPIGHVTAEGGLATFVVSAIVVGALIAWIRTGWRPPRVAAVVAVACLPLFVWASALGAGPPGGLTIRFFDVGQGDVALLTTPEGATVLFDGGPDEALVATDLAALGVRRLDIMVASHPHADHIVGLPAVLARIPVGLVLEPGCDQASELQRALDEAIDDERVDVRYPRAGDSFALGHLRLDILSPDRCWTGTSSDANNDAIVTRATYAEHVVLIASEPEEPAQQELLDAGVDLRADVLKVPHHGAATSLPEFFDAVDADVAIVSVGPNDYGHPTAFTLDAVAATGAEIYRTDRRGTITVRFSGPNLLVGSER